MCSSGSVLGTGRGAQGLQQLCLAICCSYLDGAWIWHPLRFRAQDSERGSQHPASFHRANSTHRPRALLVKLVKKTISQHVLSKLHLLFTPQHFYFYFFKFVCLFMRFAKEQKSITLCLPSCLQCQRQEEKQKAWGELMPNMNISVQLQILSATTLPGAVAARRLQDLCSRCGLLALTRF